MIRFNFILVACLAFSVTTDAKPREIWERYTFAFIGAELADPAFGAVQAGARDAARDMENEFNLAITLQFDAPATRSAELQSAIISNIDTATVHGVALNVNDPRSATQAIARLAEANIPVVTFEHDAPDAARFAYVTGNDPLIGEFAARQLIRDMWRNKGAIAIIAGNTKNTANQARLNGALSVIEKNEKVHLYGVFPCPHDASGGRRALLGVMASDRDEEIAGLLFLGGWPLLSAEPLPWTSEFYGCVAVDDFPVMLTHVQRGQVNALVSRGYYQWGYECVRLLVDKVNNNKTPENPTLLVMPTIITEREARATAEKWATWIR